MEWMSVVAFDIPKCSMNHCKMRWHFFDKWTERQRLLGPFQIQNVPILNLKVSKLNAIIGLWPTTTLACQYPKNKVIFLPVLTFTTNWTRQERNLLVSSLSSHCYSSWVMSHVRSVGSPVAVYVLRVWNSVCLLFTLDICHLTNFRLTTWHIPFFFCLLFEKETKREREKKKHQRKLASDWKKLKERNDGMDA